MARGEGWEGSSRGVHAVRRGGAGGVPSLAALPPRCDWNPACPPVQKVGHGWLCNQGRSCRRRRSRQAHPHSRVFASPPPPPLGVCAQGSVLMTVLTFLMGGGNSFSRCAPPFPPPPPPGSFSMPGGAAWLQVFPPPTHNAHPWSRIPPAHSLECCAPPPRSGGPGKGMHSRLYTRVLNQYHWVHSCASFNQTFNRWGRERGEGRGGGGERVAKGQSGCWVGCLQKPAMV